MKSLMFKVGINETSFKVNKFSIECIVNFEPDSDELIVCVHGLGCDKYSFKQLLSYPEFQNYNVLIPDLIGFGNSSKPESFSYELEEQASALSFLINKFDVKKIHLVAHSMGGAIVLLLPSFILSKVDSFANLEGNLTSKDSENFSKKIVSISQEQFDDEIFSNIKNLYNESRLLNLSSTTPKAFYASSSSLVRWSESEMLMKLFKALKTRKAYFFGEENMNNDILLKLNGIERVMIAQSGHEMMVENPDEFYNRLYDFINDSL